MAALTHPDIGVFASMQLWFQSTMSSSLWLWWWAAWHELLEGESLHQVSLAALSMLSLLPEPRAVLCCEQEVMGQGSRNTTQAVLLWGVVLSVVVAACCLWAKMGKPIPWSSALSRLGSPGRRRGASRRPMRQQV